MEKNCMEAFVGTYELVHVEICFRGFSFASVFFFPARFGRRSDIYMQRVFEIKDCSAPRACLQQRTESGQFVSLRFFIFPFFLILSRFCFTRCGRQTFSARQKRCCSWQLPTTSLQDNRTQLSNRIWSLEDKVFQELLTCRFQRLESNLLHQWLFRFRYKFRHDNRCTFSLRSQSDESNLRIKAFLPFFAAQNLFVSTNFLKAIIEGAAATLSLWFSVFSLQKWTLIFSWPLCL